MMETLNRRSDRENEKGRRGRGRPFFDGSFWSGMASVLDLFGQFHRPSIGRDPWEADLDALRGDYFAIAEDLWTAIDKYERDLSRPEQGRLFDPSELERKR